MLFNSRSRRLNAIGESPYQKQRAESLLLPSAKRAQIIRFKRCARLRSTLLDVGIRLPRDGTIHRALHPDLPVSGIVPTLRS